jgi:hypothetical protein
MYKRFFAFGCSFTEWIWPTWAEIISWDLDIPFENWGVSGIGNVGIFHQLVKCDLKNKFTEDDLIIVVWSSWQREDRYKGQKWLSGGNIFNNPYYDHKYIKRHWSLENDIIKNSTAIISANKMYDIAVQGHIMPIAEFESNKKTMTQVERRLFDLYKPHIPLDNIFEYDMNDSCGHPTVLQHLDYVETKIYPNLNLLLKQSTKDRAIEQSKK